MLPMAQLSNNNQGYISTGTISFQASYSFDPTQDPKIDRKETSSSELVTVR
ncbi:hypothetical protein DSO57_1010868 [Entomophthora muscae]|uniref:Uncharacterized protein n=1 Tax=Entomophthora muscae TaxID=34485 RepID=A0ACC2TTK4_9FUNG|nr:hypothetical protein DSO57_1010868 [Entomophthora muscae]